MGSYSSGACVRNECALPNDINCMAIRSHLVTPPVFYASTMQGTLQDNIDALQQKRNQQIPAVYRRTVKVPEEVVIENTVSDDARSGPLITGSRVNIFGKILDGDQSKCVAIGILRNHGLDLVREATDESGIASLQRTRTGGFEAALVRGPRQILGLTMSHAYTPNTLFIEDIWEDSAVAEWNKTHDKDIRICVGHVITAVNGVCSDSSDMLRRMRTASPDSTVTLRVGNVSGVSDYNIID